ncbi:hypothetical protein ACOACO_17955 [Nocardioides sp. CPCC 205120]|uniref:hypothetical protein n=1 Tax=Nocardioides sp. CPCC 205120 TaxID=3406462 RepID=UPI003B512D9C
MTIDVSYLEVASRSRDWDQQAVDLRAAGGQVDGVGGATAAFTPAVRGAVSTFCTAWTRHVEELAAGAEERADGMRDAIRDYLESDEATTFLFDPAAMVLRGALEERR